MEEELVQELISKLKKVGFKAWYRKRPSVFEQRYISYYEDFDKGLLLIALKSFEVKLQLNCSEDYSASVNLLLYIPNGILMG